MNIRRGLQLWSTRQTRGSNMKLISIGSVIICDSGHVVMSAQTPETLAGKTAKPGADEEPED